MQLDDRIRETLRGRTVLVTGAAGFIGSHLTDALVELGANVHIFVRASSRGLQNLSPEVLKAVTIHWGNLVDPYSTRAAVRAVKQDATEPPIIFHLAAQAHVGESWIRPLETFMNNTIATLNLLQAIVDEDLELFKFDLAGTSEEFGNINEDQRDFYRFREDGVVVFDERSPLNPQSPYATSKVAADFLGKNYYQAYGVPVVGTRMFNNFGPRQSPRYLTGTIITQALSRDKVVMGNPDATRDYTYVLDGVRGHLYATVFGEPGRTYAYGFGDDISNKAWAEMILKVGQDIGIWGEKELIIDPSRYRPGTTELRRLGVDYSTFKEHTGWMPEYSREEGLRETILYYHQARSRWLGMQDWA
ncbi:MAG: NAD-dependent epimerase/dehydratase family protein [Chloroflexi bacterium]|nr:NAD-dependent epimerase/dehydratase family protein [Chloroflexota bacterium]